MYWRDQLKQNHKDCAQHLYHALQESKFDSRATEYVNKGYLPGVLLIEDGKIYFFQAKGCR